MSSSKKFLIRTILLVFLFVISTQIVKYSYIKPTILAGYNGTVDLLNSFVINPQNVRPYFKADREKDPYWLWACTNGTAHRSLRFDIQTDGLLLSPSFGVIERRVYSKKDINIRIQLEDSYGSFFRPEENAETIARKFIKEPALQKATWNGIDINWYFEKNSLPTINKAFELLDLKESITWTWSIGEPLPGPLSPLSVLLFGCF